LILQKAQMTWVERGPGSEPLGFRVFDQAHSSGRTLVTCEVNLHPPNPGSLRFHEGLGFRALGEQETGLGSDGMPKRVRLMGRSWV